MTLVDWARASIGDLSLDFASLTPTADADPAEVLSHTQAATRGKQRYLLHLAALFAQKVSFSSQWEGTAEIADCTLSRLAELHAALRLILSRTAGLNGRME